MWLALPIRLLPPAPARDGGAVDTAVAELVARSSDAVGPCFELARLLNRASSSGLLRPAAVLDRRQAECPSPCTCGGRSEVVVVACELLCVEYDPQLSSRNGSLELARLLNEGCPLRGSPAACLHGFTSVAAVLDSLAPPLLDESVLDSRVKELQIVRQSDRASPFPLQLQAVHFMLRRERTAEAGLAEHDALPAAAPLLVRWGQLCQSVALAGARDRLRLSAEPASAHIHRHPLWRPLETYESLEECMMRRQQTHPPSPPCRGFRCFFQPIAGRVLRLRCGCRSGAADADSAGACPFASAAADAEMVDGGVVGGLLASDPGLGKTLECTALICAAPLYAGLTRPPSSGLTASEHLWQSVDEAMATGARKCLGLLRRAWMAASEEGAPPPATLDLATTAGSEAGASASAGLPGKRRRECVPPLGANARRDVPLPLLLPHTGRIQSRATLIVVPASIVGQWVAELGAWAPHLSVVAYSGVSAALAPLHDAVASVNAKAARGASGVTSQPSTIPARAAGDVEAIRARLLLAMVSADVVVCAFDVLASDARYISSHTSRSFGASPRIEALSPPRLPYERFPSPLFQCQWHRVIIDEVQLAASATGSGALGKAFARGILSLAGLRRWCVSGTPLASVCSIRVVLAFLRHEPFGDDHWWSRVLEPGLLLPDAAPDRASGPASTHCLTSRFGAGFSLLRAVLKPLTWRVSHAVAAAEAAGRELPPIVELVLTLRLSSGEEELLRVVAQQCAAQLRPALVGLWRAARRRAHASAASPSTSEDDVPTQPLTDAEVQDVIDAAVAAPAPRDLFEQAARSLARACQLPHAAAALEESRGLSAPQLAARPPRPSGASLDTLWDRLVRMASETLEKSQRILCELRVKAGSICEGLAAEVAPAVNRHLLDAGYAAAPSAASVAAYEQSGDVRALLGEARAFYAAGLDVSAACGDVSRATHAAELAVVQEWGRLDMSSLSGLIWIARLQGDAIAATDAQDKIAPTVEAPVLETRRMQLRVALTAAAGPVRILTQKPRLADWLADSRNVLPEVARVFTEALTRADTVVFPKRVDGAASMEDDEWDEAALISAEVGRGALSSQLLRFEQAGSLSEPAWLAAVVALEHNLLVCARAMEARHKKRVADEHNAAARATDTVDADALGSRATSSSFSSFEEWLSIDRPQKWTSKRCLDVLGDVIEQRRLCSNIIEHARMAKEVVEREEDIARLRAELQMAAAPLALDSSCRDLKTLLERTKAAIATQEGDVFRREAELRFKQQRRSGQVHTEGAEAATCSVCKTSADSGDDDAALTVCGHNYHTACLTAWLGIKRVCPVCDRPLDPVRDIFVVTAHGRGSEVSLRHKGFAEEPASASARASQAAHPMPLPVGVPATANAALPGGEVDVYGTKIAAIARRLALLQRGDKAIVVSRDWHVLVAIGAALRDPSCGIPAVTLDGTSLKRNATVSKFRDPGDASPRVLLLNSRTDSAGVTLTAASHLFIVDCGVEEPVVRQLCGRIRRLGQRKTCIVYHVVVDAPDSIEPLLLRAGRPAVAAASAAGSSTSEAALRPLDAAVLRVLLRHTHTVESAPASTPASDSAEEDWDDAVTVALSARSSEASPPPLESSVDDQRESSVDATALQQSISLPLFERSSSPVLDARTASGACAASEVALPTPCPERNVPSARFPRSARRSAAPPPLAASSSQAAASSESPTHRREENASSRAAASGASRLLHAVHRLGYERHPSAEHVAEVARCLALGDSALALGTIFPRMGDYLTAEEAKGELLPRVRDHLLMAPFRLPS